MDLVYFCWKKIQYAHVPRGRCVETCTALRVMRDSKLRWSVTGSVSRTCPEMDWICKSFNGTTRTPDVELGVMHQEKTWQMLYVRTIWTENDGIPWNGDYSSIAPAPYLLVTLCLQQRSVIGLKAVGYIDISNWNPPLWINNRGENAIQKQYKINCIFYVNVRRITDGEMKFCLVPQSSIIYFLLV